MAGLGKPAKGIYKCWRVAGAIAPPPMTIIQLFVICYWLLVGCWWLFVILGVWSLNLDKPVKSIVLSFLAT